MQLLSLLPSHKPDPRPSVRSAHSLLPQPRDTVSFSKTPALSFGHATRSVNPLVVSFMSDIAENPDDEVPRLIFADWLKDQGKDASGDLIKLNIALKKADAQQEEQLLQQIDQLHTQAKTEWNELLAEPIQRFNGQIHSFYEGFPVFQFSAKTLTATEKRFDPWGIRSYLFPEKNTVQKLNRFDQLPVLGIRLALGDTPFQEIVNNPFFANLQHLEVYGGEPYSPPKSFGNLGAEALANSPNFAQLRSLKLQSARIGNQGAVALANSPYLTNLRTLGLASNLFGTEGIQALAASKNFEQLLSLNLVWNAIEDTGAIALANSPHLKKLQSLYLMQCQIGNPGAVALANSHYLTQLRRLDLDWNEIGTPGAQALANAGNLANLHTLDLSNNQIGNAGAEALANAPHLAKLHSLKLQVNEISDPGALALVTSPQLKQLHLLDLYWNPIDDIDTLQAAAQQRRLELVL